MKKVLLTAVAVGLFSLGSSGFAQDNETMWLSGMDGKQFIYGGTMGTEGSEVLVGTGAKPADCPAGSFYTTDASQQMVMKCDDDTKYTLAAPESGAMMPDGKPYPEGTMMLSPSS